MDEGHGLNQVRPNQLGPSSLRLIDDLHTNSRVDRQFLAVLVYYFANLVNLGECSVAFWSEPLP